MLPEFVLDQCGGGCSAVRPQPAELSVAAVALLDQHGRPPALLELLLLVVAAELTLDKDGGLRHLLIKCILIYKHINEDINDKNVIALYSTYFGHIHTAKFRD